MEEKKYNIEKLKNRLNEIKDKYINDYNIKDFRKDLILNRISVGLASCGIASGAKKIYDLLVLAKKHNPELKDINIVKTGCLGICHREPIVELRSNGFSFVFGDFEIKDIRTILLDDLNKILDDLKNKLIGYYDILNYYNISGFDNEVESKREEIKKIIENKGINRLNDYFYFRNQTKIISKNFGIINPLNLAEYILVNGFFGLVNALSNIPNDVIEIIKESKLRGRGGAGFYTGIKWSLVAKHESKKYLIANADEGDLGAFMNRNEMESEPFRLLEGMMIASYAMNINEAIIYIRAEYPLAIERLEKAIDILKKYNLLGKNILGTDFDLEIYIKKGAGAYVCGEETALIKSIEGKRGMPVPKPPYPTDKGLFGKPTCINNVGSLCHVASIFQIGVDNYIKYGTEKTKGTKVLCLTGAIKNTGVIEIEFGFPLKKLVDDIVKQDIKALQLGGPSGGCIPYSELNDLILDYESINQKGAIIGSGGIVFLDNKTDMVKLAQFFLSFANFESCGQCLPCREGTKRLLELLNKFMINKAELKDINRIIKLSNFIKSASLCGLGKTAPNPVLATIKYFRNEYLDKIKKKQYQ